MGLKWCATRQCAPRIVGDIRTRVTAIMVSVVVTLFRTASAAPAPAPFFAGKTITIIVSYGPGGGYDTYARLMAAHLSAHLAGAPNVVVENMPGAGGLVGGNYLFNVAPRDGTILGVVNQSAAVAQTLGVSGIRYDARKFNWIGRMASGREVSYVWHTSPVSSIDDAKRYSVLIGGSGPTSTSEVLPRMMNQLLGTKFKLISGYPDGAAGALALQRGEIEGYSTEWAVLKSQYSRWLDERTIKPLVQYALERAPDLPNVPTSIELGKNDEQRKIFALMASGDEMGRTIAAPPGVPTDRVQALRAAFNATVKDPAFIADAKKVRYEVEPLTGDQLSRIVAKVSDTPHDVVARAKRLSSQPSE